MFCCGKGPRGNDRYSTFSDACYTANMDKIKELLKKAAKNEKALVNERGEVSVNALSLSVSSTSCANTA